VVQSFGQCSGGGLAVQDRYNPAVRCAARSQASCAGRASRLNAFMTRAPPRTLHTGKHTLQLTATGFDQWMVWNPGQAAAKDMADLPDADWKRMG